MADFELIVEVQRPPVVEPDYPDGRPGGYDAATRQAMGWTCMPRVGDHIEVGDLSFPVDLVCWSSDGTATVVLETVRGPIADGLVALLREEGWTVQ